MGGQRTGEEREQGTRQTVDEFDDGVLVHIAAGKMRGQDNI